MGRKIKLTLLLLFVFVAGGVLGLVLSSVMWKRYAMSPYYNLGLLEIAIDAQQLSQGREDEVLKRKVRVIPVLTEAYYNHYYKWMPDDDSRYTSLWQVQKYYEISGDEIPSQLKSILESLPPKPLSSCELKRLEEAKSPVEQDSQ
ncbi:MAG: hypothetical protein B6I25_08055 [Planctomycetales bacterium 4572_13]|nr:MAG: hypothetical protein B6I25_08055 [Planctomycetales bacterium 4572_13]